MAKKGIVVLVIMLAVVFAQTAPGTASTSVYSYFKMVKLVIGQTLAEVNYKPATMEQAAYVKQSRTLVPLRFIGESLGAQVTWNDTTKQAFLNLAGTNITVTIGSKVAYVDGHLTTLDVPAERKGGRTFVPLRFVSESFGGYVDYDQDTKTILVRYANKTTWKHYKGPTTGLEFDYPPDWVATTTAEGQVDVFMSPQGSLLSALNSDRSPKTLYDDTKKAARDKGWTVEVDEPYNPDNLDEGYKLELTIYNSEIHGYIREIIYVDPVDGGSYIVDEIMDDNYADIESVVMLEIAYS